MAFSTSMDDVHVMRSNIDNSSGLLPPYMWQLNKYMLFTVITAPTMSVLPKLKH